MKLLSRTTSATAILAALFALSAFPVAAQDAMKEWNDVLARAKGKELNLAVHAVDGHPHAADVFKQKFPDIKVNLTTILPSAFVPRAITEQKNGLFVWDSFWGGTSNLVGTLLPAGGIAKFDDYLVHPDVKDMANWNAPQYLWGSDGPFIFLHANFQEAGMFYNSAVVRGVDSNSLDLLLDPRLKGKISVRDPSRPNVATASLAGIIKVKGEDFARKVLTEMNPVVLENPRQADDTLLRGESAVLIGGSQDTFATCKKQQACPTVDKWSQGTYLRSIGVIVLKNAPHPDTTKVWINWLLSKEGQETFVREYGKFNDSGAISMRKDVAPHPNNVDRVPDYSKMGQYLRTSVAEGEVAQQQVTRLWTAIKNK